MRALSGAIAALVLIAMNSALWATPKTLTLRLGCTGFAKEANVVTVRVFEKYLSKGLGIKVRAVLYPNYNDIIHELLNQNIELAMLSPIMYVNVTETCKVHTLGYMVFVSGNFSYRSVILTNKGSTIRRLSDLRRRKVAFVDKLSASGYIYPRLMLTKARVRGRSNLKALFYGNHVDAVRALMEGKVDAACTYDTLFREVKGLGKRLCDFRVLGKSDPIPPDAFIALPKVPLRIRKRITELLLDYHTLQRKDPKLRTPIITGWIPPDPNIYDGLKKLYRKLTQH